jgi:hypothetical protein
MGSGNRKAKMKVKRRKGTHSRFEVLDILLMLFL